MRVKAKEGNGKRTGREGKDKEEKMVERTCRIGTKVDEGRRVICCLVNSKGVSQFAA